MEIFRICKSTFAGSLLASGVANRWNRAGEKVIYSAGSRSLATLELVVHRSAISLLQDYRVMVISIPEQGPLLEVLDTRSLPDNWRQSAAYPRLQQMGSHWYREQRSLVLQIPSAVIPQEFNYMIHTEHPEFAKKVKLLRAEPYFWDERLF